MPFQYLNEADEVKPSGSKFRYLDEPEDSQPEDLASKVYRPVLEGGGAIGGAVLASPGGPISSAAGGTLGYAAGRGAANRIDEMRGMKKAPQNLKEGLSETEEGLRQGAIAELGGQAISKTIQAVPKLKDVAEGAARRSLGYTKKLLNTPLKREQAHAAAKVALEEDLITPLSSAEDILTRTKALAEKSGKSIGEFLKETSKGNVFNAREAIEKLNTLRPPQRGGAYDVVHKKIDNAIQTVGAHIKEYLSPMLLPKQEPISFETANKLKGVLQDLAKFSSTSGEKAVDRKIAGVFRQYLDDVLETVSGGGQGFKDFLADKRKFGASENIKDALENRLSSEMGNNVIGLDTAVLAAGQLAQGRPGAAATQMGVMKVLKEYGLSTTAVVAKELDEFLNRLPVDKARVVMENPTVLKALIIKLQGSDNANSQPR